MIALVQILKKYPLSEGIFLQESSHLDSLPLFINDTVS
jgi:hypothetical protein